MKLDGDAAKAVERKGMYHLRTIEYDKQLCGFGKFRF